MKRRNVVLLLVLGTLALGGIIYGSIRYSQQGIVTVQTGKVVRQELVSQVTASGEIKPRNYINIGANSMGPAAITEIQVKEGDRVKRGQLLAKLETVQPAADVTATEAALRTAQADLASSDAAIKSAAENLATVRASLLRAKADRERADLEFKRGQQLYTEQLIPKSDFDQRKATYDSAAAGVTEAEARIMQNQAMLDQAKANRESVQRRVEQFKANVTRVSDILRKYYSIAPLDGVVTNLPVRVGETVVPGIQNSPASLIMTIADMSLITAEVKVDETDIVNVKLGQVGDITIDAIPNKTFKGHVIEMGNPIQALTIRTAADLEPKKKSGDVAHAADKPATPPSKDKKKEKEEIQGVFVVSNKKAAFRKVNTGITGASDIEVLDGLKEGDEIVTGSYKVLRTIRPDTSVKVDNRAPKKEKEEEVK
ncbi:MAG: efflux RND transporter periplasmic adaptor subunit [Acidobacteria bacterium]|nr:efflux RND transporter periplasmic adaptor subunit [Acidobacteriota bacterium]